MALGSVLNVPISLAILVAGPRLLDGTRRRARARDFDLPGALLVTGALLLLVYALTKAPDVGWGATRTIAELGGAAALLIAFLGNEARVERPLLPLRTFRLPGVAAANGSAILMFSAVVPLFFFLMRCKDGSGHRRSNGHSHPTQDQLSARRAGTGHRSHSGLAAGLGRSLA